MPFRIPTADRDNYTMDLDPERAIELAGKMETGKGETVYVVQRTEGDPGVGDGATLFVGDFPTGATLIAVITRMGRLENISSPMTLSAADELAKSRESAGERVAIFGWRKESGIYRVAALSRTVLGSVTPKIDAVIVGIS